MQITVNVQDSSIAEKIVWFLSTLKDKGVEIVSDMHKSYMLGSNHHDSDALSELDDLIKIKSKEATLVEVDTILNPHKELSSDIS